LDQKHKLIPGAALIYERADGITYAKYRDPPHNKIPRWIIGGDPEAVSRAQGTLFSYLVWQDMMELAKEYPTLQKQLEKAVNTYYIVKDQK
jgi:hypothetical protein